MSTQHRPGDPRHMAGAAPPALPQLPNRSLVLPHVPALCFLQLLAGGPCACPIAMMGCGAPIVTRAAGGVL